ncbi:hypothetical protein EC973_009155, partial [Apophysomyces ossiformis]
MPFCAACVTLATTYSNNVAENFESRLKFYISRRLTKLIPGLSQKNAKAIAGDYIYELLARSDPHWPFEDEIAVSDFDQAVETICGEFAILMPEWQTNAEKLSASPGSYIPV